MHRQTYDVTGMTCDHCLRAVTAEVSALPGVSDIDIDLATGKVTVTSDQPISTDQVREAVTEAGYTLAS